MISNFIKITLALFLLASCNKSKNIECDGSNPKYNSEIKTLIDNNCMPCHGVNGSQDDYSTYQKIKATLDNGEFEREVLTKRTMPDNGSFSDSELSKIKCWIEGGYQEN